MYVCMVHKFMAHGVSDLAKQIGYVNIQSSLPTILHSEWRMAALRYVSHRATCLCQQSPRNQHDGKSSKGEQHCSSMPEEGDTRRNKSCGKHHPAGIHQLTTRVSLHDRSSYLCVTFDHHQDRSDDSKDFA